MLLQAGLLGFEMQYTSAVLERYVERIKMGKCHNFLLLVILILLNCVIVLWYQRQKLKLKLSDKVFLYGSDSVTLYIDSKYPNIVVISTGKG